MTIFGMRYRPAPYTEVGGLRRLWPLARLELGALFRSRWGVALFFLCAFPSLVRLVMLLVWLGVLGIGPAPQLRRGPAPDILQGLLPDRPDFYVEPVVATEQGFFVLLLLTALTTARAVAKDRATNALEFYWTRGISPRGYFLAKWCGATLLVATLTVGVPVLLWLLGVLLSDDWALLGDTIGFVPGVVAGLAVFTIALTTPCALLSAIAGSANLATILWCMLLGGSLAAAEVANGLLRTETGSWLSLWEAAATMARGLAGIAQPRASVGGALVLWLLVVGVLAALAVRRLRVQGAIG